MKSEIAKLHHQNEEVMAEHQHLDDDLKWAVYEGKRMQKLNNDLMEELEFLEKKMRGGKDNSKLGGENSRLQEEADEKLPGNNFTEEIISEGERAKQLLQDALHYRREIEGLFEAEQKRRKEMENSLRVLKEELDNRDLQIERFLNEERKLISEKEDLEEKLYIALNHGNELNSLLEEAAMRKAKKIANELEEEVQKRETQIRHLLGQGERLQGRTAATWKRM
ncbi:uncharacterized protein LOC135222319 [Macrobrachium nipponense]|uniref:uncharacterized protein LOC135222319 n=1 Tax=Macrobrachium nipponense TaxID=159736 RepID=UPI0030C874E0